MEQDSKYKLFCIHEVLRDFYHNIDIYCYPTFDLNYIKIEDLNLPSNLCLHLNDMCLVNVFNSFIPTICFENASALKNLLFCLECILC